MMTIPHHCYRFKRDLLLHPQGVLVRCVIQHEINNAFNNGLEKNQYRGSLISPKASEVKWNTNLWKNFVHF